MELAKKVDSFGDLVTLEKAGKMMGVTPNSVYIWMRYNRIPHVRVGKTIMLSQNELVSYNPRRAAAK